jgi:hypothetical protein
MNGPWDVRVIGFEGFRTLNLDGVDGCPGLLGARGTHLFILLIGIGCMGEVARCRLECSVETA